MLLRRAVDVYEPSDELRERFMSAGLDPFLNDALKRLRAAPELDDATATAPPDPLDHRRAIGRALVAATLTSAEDASLPAVDGETRDALVLAVTTELHGHGMGVGSFLLRPVKGLNARMVTRKLTGDRGSLSDATSPAAGDILRFLAHGGGARTFVQRAIGDSPLGRCSCSRIR